ncbi:hypothetical protein GCM10027160_32510 [Streptomyces calidiresistens]
MSPIGDPPLPAPSDGKPLLRIERGDPSPEEPAAPTAVPVAVTGTPGGGTDADRSRPARAEWGRREPVEEDTHRMGTTSAGPPSARRGSPGARGRPAPDPAHPTP